MGNPFKDLKHGWDKLRGKDKEREAKRNAQALLNDENARRLELKKQNDNVYNQRLGQIKSLENLMRGSADRLYNIGASNLKRASDNAYNTIRHNMAQRGITSGLDLDSLVNREYNTARGLSSLQGERANRLAENQRQIMDMYDLANRNHLDTKASIYGAPRPAAEHYQNTLESIAAGRKGMFNTLTKAAIGHFLPIPLKQPKMVTFNPLLQTTLNLSGLNGLPNLFGF